jgi:hypothetical protein
LVKLVAGRVQVLLKFTSALGLDLLPNNLSDQSLLLHQLLFLRVNLAFFLEVFEQLLPEGVLAEGHGTLEEIDALVKLSDLSLATKFLCFGVTVSTNQLTAVTHVAHWNAAIGETVHEEEGIVERRCSAAASR